MKNDSIKRIYFFGIIFFLTLPLLAQKPIECKEMQCSFSHGEYPGFSLTIPEANYDFIAKSWTKRLEKRTKSKMVIEGDEYSIFGALISEISVNPINIYTKLHVQDSAVVLDVSFELKPKEFLSKAQFEKEYVLVTDHLYQFGKQEYTVVAENQLKGEEKKLKTLEKELLSLQDSKSKLEKGIIEEQNDILSSNDKIELLKKDASYINDQIGNEKAILLGLKTEEDIKAKETQIKTLEKDKKQVLNTIEGLQKKIVDSNSDNHTAELDIQSNVTTQSAKKAEVDEQRLVVDKANTKLNTIMAY